MDRLTERYGRYIRIKGNTSLYLNEERKSAPLQSAIVRLATYEDTGLMPEEIAALVKAQDDGRVVVLDDPRKPLVWGDDNHDTCLCPECGKDLMGIPYIDRMVLQCPVCGQYLDATKAITRTEAKAAQAGKENEK